jgi:hypothetical protein
MRDEDDVCGFGNRERAFEHPILVEAKDRDIRHGFPSIARVNINVPNLLRLPV